MQTWQWKSPYEYTLSPITHDQQCIETEIDNNFNVNNQELLYMFVTKSLSTDQLVKNGNDNHENENGKTKKMNNNSNIKNVNMSGSVPGKGYESRSEKYTKNVYWWKSIFVFYLDIASLAL